MKKLFERLGEVDIPSKSIKCLLIALGTFWSPSLVGVLWVLAAFEPVFSKFTVWSNAKKFSDYAFKTAVKTEKESEETLKKEEGKAE